MIEPFLLKAFAAGAGLAVLTAPLGSVVVWSRMAYFGEAVAHAGLIGIALALSTGLDRTLAVLLVTLAASGLLLLLGRQNLVPLDSVLGLIHHGSLSLGIIAAAMLAGPGVDLQGYLFGDIFAVSETDLALLAALGLVVGLAMWHLWQPLLRIALDPDLAAAEGVPRERVRLAFTIVLALAVALAVKFVGVLLVIAFLVVPAVAARPFAASPEQMVWLASGIGIGAVLAGLSVSLAWDAPGGPAIVLAMALAAAASLVAAGLRKSR
ncbi:MAG: metal ABC transporter permease [Hyphomicrobiaceae bacterium]|nr:metal ABC transporter permease [Hyphomicrobiaceae bacterium]